MSPKLTSTTFSGAFSGVLVLGGWGKDMDK